MGLSDRLTSLLGSGGGPETTEETVEYKCSTCGARFEQPTGGDICPECYETGVTRVDEAG